MHDINDARARLEIAQQKTAEAKSFLDFFRESPQYACDANESLLREFHHGETITLQSLRESADFLKGQLAVKDNNRIERDQSDERIDLLAQYQQAISGWSSEAIKGEMSKARYWTADQIKEKLVAVQSRKAMQEKTIPELRLISNARQVPEQAELPANMTREYLLSLNGPGAFKAVVSRWGSAAVARRLNQK